MKTSVFVPESPDAKARVEIGIARRKTMFDKGSAE